MRKMGEDLLLQITDQGQEPVSHRGNRHPDNRSQRQQPQVAARTQHGHRISRHRHQPSIVPVGPPRLTHARTLTAAFSSAGPSARHAADSGPSCVPAAALSAADAASITIPPRPGQTPDPLRTHPSGRACLGADQLPVMPRRTALPSLPEPPGQSGISLRRMTTPPGRLPENRARAPGGSPSEIPPIAVTEGLHDTRTSLAAVPGRAPRGQLALPADHRRVHAASRRRLPRPDGPHRRARRLTRRHRSRT